MMDELIRIVVDKTGLSEEHARTAVETVLNFLRGRLPAPLAGEIDKLLQQPAGAGAGASQDPGMFGALGGMLGGKGPGG